MNGVVYQFGTEVQKIPSINSTNLTGPTCNTVHVFKNDAAFRYPFLLLNYINPFGS